MKKQLNPKQDSGLSQFLVVLEKNFSASLTSLISNDVAIKRGESYTCSGKEILENTDGQTIISFNETGLNIKAGLLIPTIDASAMADLMMMGTGEGVPELNDELKDAVKELFSQMVSSVNVPMSELVTKKISYNVESIYSSSDEADFLSEDIFAVELNTSYMNKNCKLIFFNNITMFNTITTSDDDDGISEDFFSTLSAPQKMNEQAANNSFRQNLPHGGRNIDMLLDVEIPVSVRVGSTKAFLKDIVSLGPGNIVELDEYADEAVELLVNNKPIARGEVVIVDGYFGIRIKEIISKEERIKKLKD